MTPASSPLADQAERNRIRASLDESLIVEASAGTGKTTELVQRIVAVLASGRTTIDKLAAVTFTHKAAGELKLRLRQELDRARHQPLPHGRGSEGVSERRASEFHDRPLEAALEHLEEASIGTIHSFCAQILRERPVEARVDPAFVELSEPESRRLYNRAFRAWLERKLNDDSPGLRRAFARLAHRDSWDSTPPLQQLQFAGWKLIEWRDHDAPWRKEPFARDEEIATLVRMLRDLADLSSKPRRVNDNLYKALEPVRLLAQWIERAEALSPRDHDSLESLLLKLGRDLNRSSNKGSGEYGGGVARETLVTNRDELLLWTKEFRQRADAELAGMLQEELSGLVGEYTRKKEAIGALDFTDLLLKTAELLRGDAEIRRHLQARFTHLFVDEFQDTDPLQAEILLLLASDNPSQDAWLEVRPQPGKLFLVGDPKQSVYKFRRADLVLYRDLCRRLIERGVGLVSLTSSFRSVPNIQQFVNAAFETEMAAQAGNDHANWQPLERVRPATPGRPSVIALPVPRPYRVRLHQDSINKSLADAVAAFAAWLIQESGWEIDGGREAMRRIEARDIAVLFRRRTQAGADLTRDYARALEARNVPHLLAGSKSFHHREEVETLRAALTAVEWPDDELSVFATLKGPLFAISDEVLLLYRHAHGSLHPFRHAGDDPKFQIVVEALEHLATLHRQRNRRPFAATVNALLEATRAHAAFLLRPGGNQVLANVGRVAELARSFETTGGISFRGFVEELTQQAEKEEASEAPVLEEDSDGVRLLTVHGAKGLEFPVVILADLTAKISRRDPDQFIDGARRLCATRLLGCAPHELRENEGVEAARERAEGVRVAYVAATRARDILVVPAIGDEMHPPDGWLSPLFKALYPSQNQWRGSRPAEGCPPFGQATVLERPVDYVQQPEFSVRPGLIQPSQGNHEVVWWDPAKLRLNEDGEDAHDRVLSEILKEDSGRSMLGYRAWQEARATAIHSGSRPEFEVFLASQASAEPAAGEPVEIETIESARAAAKGSRRFGTLVHAILSEIPLDADASRIRQLATLNGRIFGAPLDEVKAACEAVEGALRHPVIARARVASRCHREYPVLWNPRDNVVMEGVIDLAFVESGKWVVVDFKTTADIAAHRREYERQLQWYTHALRSLTGMPGKAVLFGV